MHSTAVHIAGLSTAARPRMAAACRLAAPRRLGTASDSLAPDMASPMCCRRRHRAPLEQAAKRGGGCAHSLRLAA